MTRLRRYLTYGIGSTLVVGGAAFLYFFKTRGGYQNFLDMMYVREFSDIPMIQPENLAAEMEGPEPPLLLDVRTPEEYAVSHIRIALLANPATFDIDDFDDVDRDRKIVLYCSIGYRSGLLTRELLQHGFVDVRNLYGGIFLWYNNGMPVYQGSRIVEQIHPYKPLWGQFITRRGKVEHSGDQDSASYL
jgi:rhodanese-related sulfurtransferase